MTSALSSAPPPGASDPEPSQFVAGTLRYTKAGLSILFFYLLWNDLCLMLMEQVAPQLVPLLMKSHGATNRQMAFYLSTLGGIFTIWINPFVSTWSDRHRGALGRRRPFLLFATPPCALCLAMIPFAPDILRLLLRWPLAAHLLGGGSINGVVLFLGLFNVAYAVFNSVILAIFTYYFWDVVPENVLGRFTALMKVISTLATLLWNFFFFGLAEQHMKAIFVSIAAVFLVIYLITLWRVKEGEYPPPDERKSVAEVSDPFLLRLPPPILRVVVAAKTALEPIRVYFVECFSHPYYLWVFGAYTIYQIGNLSGMYQIFYLHGDLALSLDTIGKMKSPSQLVIMALAFPVGALIDRLNPIRMVAPSLLIWSAMNVLAFFFLHGKWSLMIFFGLIQLSAFLYQMSSTVLNVEVFPREKLGQFCSANAISQQVTCFFVALLVGTFFDYVKDYRYTFIWAAVFQFLAAIMFLKVYRNWRRIGGHNPVPHAGTSDTPDEARGFEVITGDQHG